MSRAMGAAGGYALARRLTRDSPRILMYHRFAAAGGGGGGKLGADEFDRQLAEITRYYRVKTLGDLVVELRQTGRAEPGSVVLTIDDGYRDFHEHAFPVLQRRGVNATLFVTSGFLDGQLWLWPDVLEYALMHTDRRELEASVDGRHHFLSFPDIPARRLAARQLARISLGLPDETMRAWHGDLLRQLRVELPACPPPGYEPLSWDQVRELDAAGVEIGAHTITHPALSRVRPERLRHEIAGSKERIEQELGHTIRSFCYPNGTADDLSPLVKAEVQAAGFTCAPVAYYDSNVTTDLFELRRVPTGNWRRKFREGLHGVDLLQARRRRRRKGP